MYFMSTNVPVVCRYLELSAHFRYTKTPCLYFQPTPTKQAKVELSSNAANGFEVQVVTTSDSQQVGLTGATTSDLCAAVV